MKKITSLILTGAVLCLALAGCGGGEAQQTQPPTDPTQTAVPVDMTCHEPAAAFAGGTGSEADPYQISNAQELALLSQKLREEPDGYANASYLLTGDIALNETADFDRWSETAPEYHWQPIDSFGGTFDGDGHTVTGMYIADPTLEWYGLFSLSTGSIRDVKLDKSYLAVSGSNTNGGLLVGELRGEGTVEQCSVGGMVVVQGSGNVGGLAGKGGIVNDCEFSGTIVQQDDSFSNMGGILGYGGQITNCTNYGRLVGKDYTGGICGWGSLITGCVNKGTVTGDTAGGISGNIYEAGMGIEPEFPKIGIDGCANEGQVTGTTLAGGIVGKLGNDEQDISMFVTNCENRGQVLCDEAVGGIVGKLLVERTGDLTVQNCVNQAELSGIGKVGGIICEFTGGVMNQIGNVSITGCRNLAPVTCQGDYAGGVLAYFALMGSETDLQLTLADCSNEAPVTAQKYVGGIMGFSSSLLAGNLEIAESSSITLENCQNSGQITALTSNSYAGGIAGNFSAEGIKAVFDGCSNTGTVRVELSLTEEQIQDTLADGVKLTLSQMVGGIIGRLGEGALSFTDLDEGNAANVQAENPWILLRGCENTGSLTATDLSRYRIDDHQVWVSFIGGLIGNTCAEDAYSCAAENCTYTGTDRGLGNPEYPDLGTKK